MSDASQEPRGGGAGPVVGVGDLHGVQGVAADEHDVHLRVGAVAFLVSGVSPQRAFGVIAEGLHVQDRTINEIQHFLLVFDHHRGQLVTRGIPGAFATGSS